MATKAKSTKAAKAAKAKKPARIYPGRPKLPDSQKRRHVYGVRLNDAEQATLDALTAKWRANVPELTPHEAVAHLLRQRLAWWAKRFSEDA